MRDIIVFAFVMLSLPSCFRRPFLGMLMFTWLAYMRPQDLCWGFARTMRFSLLVALTMLAGWFVNERGRRAFAVWDPRTRLMVVLALCTSISYAFADLHDEHTNTFFFEFFKIIVIALFTSGQVDSKKRYYAMVWAVALSLGFYGVKNGLFGILRGGQAITRGPGGMLEDNNDFALAMVMNIPLLWYLGRAELERLWIGKCTKIGVALTVVTVLLTHSRGAFLAMCATALWIAWRSGRLLRASAALGLLAVAFFALAPSSVIDRLSSISDTQESSAASRLASWKIALRMVEDNPVWGVGLRNFRENYVRYADDPMAELVETKVAHNSYLQIWAESGTLAFAAYLAILYSVFLTCRRLYRMGRSRPDLHWISDYARMMEATTAGFLVGSFFLNRGHFDLLYHWIALVSALAVVAHRAANAAPPVGALAVAAGPGRHDVEVRVRRRGTHGAGAAPVWGSVAHVGAAPQWRRRG